MFQTAYKSDSSVKQVKKVVKPFSNLPITTPWRYRVPFMNVKLFNKEQYKCDSNKSQNTSTKKVIQEYVNISTNNNKYIYNSDVSQNIFKKHLDNFYRLMHLFPMIHPAVIHGIIVESNYDLTRAIDKLLRVKMNAYNKHISRTNLTRILNRGSPTVGWKNYSNFCPNKGPHGLNRNFSDIRNDVKRNLNYRQKFVPDKVYIKTEIFNDNQ